MTLHPVINSETYPPGLSQPNFPMFSGLIWITVAGTSEDPQCYHTYSQVMYQNINRPISLFSHLQLAKASS